jgi:hypothetical protein
MIDGETSFHGEFSKKTKTFLCGSKRHVHVLGTTFQLVKLCVTPKSHFRIVQYAISYVTRLQPC